MAPSACGSTNTASLVRWVHFTTQSMTCPRVWHVSFSSIRNYAFNIFQRVAVTRRVLKRVSFLLYIHPPQAIRCSSGEPSNKHKKCRSPVCLCDSVHWCYNIQKEWKIYILRSFPKVSGLGELCCTISKVSLKKKKKNTYYATAVHMNIVWAIYLDT